jgi:TetR/AcrR family transcriptional regulator, lmrAB and yxaGH operons repressor
LISDAVALVGDGSLRALAKPPAQLLVDTMESFTALWRKLLVGSDCRAGCAVAAVMIDDDGELLAAAAEVFRGWTSALTDEFKRCRLHTATARRLARMAIAGTEGALILSRAQGTLQLFDDVAAQLKESAALLE